MQQFPKDSSALSATKKLPQEQRELLHTKEDTAEKRQHACPPIYQGSY